MQTDPGRAGFAPVVTVDGYLPLEDHGLVGDGSTAALVGRDGCVAWLCAPSFDDDPVFCSILDTERGGSFRLSPGDVVGARQRYEPDTGVLVTEIRSATGTVRITDCLTLRADADLTVDVAAGRGELLRTVDVLDGTVRMTATVEPRGGGTAQRRDGGLRITGAAHPPPALDLVSSRPLDGLRTTFDLAAGHRAAFALRWGDRAALGDDFSALLDATVQVWRRWANNIAYDGPQEPLVRRASITLKMLDYFQTGAMVAAPTSSLPEAIGGPRNWDYRYTWVRDAAFSVYALRRVGLAAEAWGFLRWVLDAVDRDGQPRVLYTLDGRQPPAEREDPDLRGYRGSGPVRWGNAAAEQRQHDAYGEIIDCAYLWGSGGGELAGVWPRLVELVDAARTSWSRPDHGIWEVRTPGRVFTYSAAMCQVALDRGARLSGRLGLPGDQAGWRAEADRVVAAILRDAWDADRGSLTEHLGPGGGLDASLLALPLRRVLDARHPQMTATVEAVRRRLDAGDGLLYRYLPQESPDGVGGEEGAFLLCSFWLVENLALQGRVDEAVDLYDSLCGRAGPLGLLPEQVDPTTGAFLGNFPQAFSHVGVISAGVNLARLLRR